MKATAKAPSNIAFIKYWGRRDEVLRLPENGSISMNLSGMMTNTTVEFSPRYDQDIVIIDSQLQTEESNRVSMHLNRIREIAQKREHAKVVSKNSFPSSTGLSSSASGFAALTLAASTALSLSLSEKELSILARQGSGSACRSVPNGFVEWLDGGTNETSYGVSLYPPDYWDLCDVVVLVSTEKKEVTTSEGQQRIGSSPFFPARKMMMNDKIRELKDALNRKDFEKLGEISEREAMEMHAVMLTSWPSLIYWTEETLCILKQVQRWRSEGIPVYFTLNTGQDVHLLCQKQTVDTLQQLLAGLPYVHDTIINYPGFGASVVDQHLF